MPFPEFHCRTLHDLRRHISDFTQNNGMKTYGFVAEMRNPRNDDQPDLHFLTNHPEAWRRSIEQSLETGTPHNMVRHAWLHLPPLGWSASGHLAGHTIIDDLARQHVRSMGGWGVQSGALCPVSAPEIEWGALVWFTDQPLAHGTLKNLVGDCALYAAHFSFWYLQITHRRNKKRDVRLTPRESECLLWASQGKTSIDIGQILGISERTVEGYFATASAKLNARGRQAAITRARDLRLIGGRNSLLAEFERQRDEASGDQAPQVNEPSAGDQESGKDSHIGETKAATQPVPNQ